MKVALADFFLADQLTSQVQAFRSLEFYICYYGSGDYAHRDSSCSSNEIYRTFHYIVAIIPYWSRLLQVVQYTLFITIVTNLFTMSLTNYFWPSFVLNSV